MLTSGCLGPSCPHFLRVLLPASSSPPSQLKVRIRLSLEGSCLSPERLPAPEGRKGPTRSPAMPVLHSGWRFGPYTWAHTASNSGQAVRTGHRRPSHPWRLCNDPRERGVRGAAAHSDACVLGAPPAHRGGRRVGNLTAVFSPRDAETVWRRLPLPSPRLGDPAKPTKTKRVPPGKVQAPARTRQPGPGELPPGRRPRTSSCGCEHVPPG